MTDANVEPVRIGIHGIGGLAGHYVSLLRQIPGAVVTAVSHHQDTEPAHAFVGEHALGLGRGACFNSLQRMLDAGGLDAVISCSWRDRFAGLAAVEAGVSVLVNPLMCTNLDHARELAEADAAARRAAGAGRRPAVGYALRLHHAVAEMSEFLAPIGPIVNVVARWTGTEPTAARDPGTALERLGATLLDVAWSTIGAPAPQVALARTLPASKGRAADALRGTIELAGGTLVSLALGNGHSLSTAGGAAVELEGELGTVGWRLSPRRHSAIDGLTCVDRHVDGTRKTERTPLRISSPDTFFLALLKQFVDAVRGDGEVSVDTTYGVGLAQMLDAVARSANGSPRGWPTVVR